MLADAVIGAGKPVLSLQGQAIAMDLTDIPVKALGGHLIGNDLIGYRSHAKIILKEHRGRIAQVLNQFSSFLGREVHNVALW